MASPSLFTRHPFKFLFTVYYLSSLPLRVLIAALYYLPPSNRSGRTYRLALTTRLMRFWFDFATAVEFRLPKSLEPGADKARFVFIDPNKIEHCHSSPYVGVLDSNPAINPAPIAGFWYEAPPPVDKTPGLAVVHFHGGAFVLGGARPTDAFCSGPIALSKRLDCPVLMPQYRLSNSRDRTTCFPAALQDAVTAYTYLLYTLDVAPENIVLSGDSAGGNLVIALLRYIQNEAADHHLPLPRAILLWSPWVDLRAPGSSQYDCHRNVSTDFLFDALGDWGVRCYLPDGWDSKHPFYPYISPLGQEFQTEVPIFIQTGRAEVLYDSHVEFTANLKKRGCAVEYVEIDNAPHDTFVAAEIFGIREQEGAIDRAAKMVIEAGTPP
ncbi:Alpha/Beta hydrolase protein [Aspergillus nidulans var. acristatus]